MRSSLLILLLLFVALLQAQAPHFFRHYTEKDGLSSNVVTCVLRDREGFLWVGTNYGLNRFDGRNFRQFLPDAGAPERTVSNEYINAMAQDDSGYLWIATRNGLNRYDPASGTFKVWQNTGPDDGSLPNSLVNYLRIDGRRLWLACDNRDLVCMDTRSGKFLTFPWKQFADKAWPENSGKDYKTIHSISKKSETEIWLHTNLGLFDFEINKAGFSFYPGENQKIKPFVPGGDCPETAFFGSWDMDVLCLDLCTREWQQARLPVTPSMKDGFRYIARVEKAAGRYWVLSQQGLFIFDPQTGKISAVRPGLSNQFSAPKGLVVAVCADPDGTLWFGGEEGLWQLDPRLQQVHHVPLDTTPYASYSNRYSIILDIPEWNRRLVCDYYRGNVLVLDNDRPLKTIPLGGVAKMLQRDKNGTIWVSGGKNVYQLDPKSLRLTPFTYDEKLLDPSEKTAVVAIEEDAAGNLWLATDDRGVLVFQKKEGKWTKPGAADGFFAKDISCMYADTGRKTVWIGTYDYGLFRYDEGARTFRLYRHEAQNPDFSLGAYMVRAICRDGQGKIWVATDPGGISRFDYAAPIDREFITLSTRNGLPSNQVCALITDTKGNIWAGTTKGLAWVDTHSLQLRSWNKNSGIQNEFIDLPLSLGASGEIHFGGTKGYEYFFPDSLLMEADDPRILLTSFKVFDRELIGTFDDSVHLNWQENFFSVEFASANFSRPEKNTYAVRLLGFDADWKPCGTRGYAAWTNVHPGTYQLEVKSIREGRERAPGLRITINIEPPFWQKWWFRLLSFGAVSAAIYALYQYRVGRVRREEQMKSEFKRKLAQVEMSALRAQMNPHFVFNCLNSINRFILVNDPDSASNYLTKFSRLIRLILDNSRTETVLLDKEIDALRLYIELEVMRFDGHFDYSISIAPGLPTEHIEVPPMLIQPFVENAIWHGLMHKKEHGQLSVRIFEENNALCIEIEDDGVGRSRAAELKSKSAQTHKSHGMQVTSERVEIIRQLYGVETGIVIDDLTDPNGAASGTRVKISISRL